MAAPSRIGRYEIKTSLGKGGMGSLYIARDPNTGRLVAVKLLSAHLDSEELKVRFEVEAKALAQLNHPNIVDIYDSGQFRGSPFIVMEYVRGETLDEMIRRSAPLSQSLKLKLIAQLCAGLAHAHDAGVIHRDIKPANLMVEDRSQRLKIVDFGIARVTEGLTRIGKMTRLNVQIGTPGYMSPEQVEGEALDHRSDVFAVGVVLYELLTNTTAFPGNNTRQIEKKVLEEQPPALNTVVPDLDPAVQAIVDRALQKDPAQRYQSALEFAEALDSVHERLGKGVNEMRGNVRPSPVTPGKLSPAPVAKGSRADVAFQRSQCAYTDGAVEAAKRFAVEALVEDAGHEAARAFLKKVDPQRWVPPPPPKHGAVPPTQVARPPGSRGTELADDSGYDATIVSPRPAVGNWDSSSSDAGSQEWDPFGRTVVVRPGQGVGGAPWPGGDTSEDSGELVDRTVFVPQHEEPGGWPSSRTDADPYDRTIIAPRLPLGRRGSGTAFAQAATVSVGGGGVERRRGRRGGLGGRRDVVAAAPRGRGRTADDREARGWHHHDGPTRMRLGRQRLHGHLRARGPARIRGETRRGISVYRLHRRLRAGRPHPHDGPQELCCDVREDPRGAQDAESETDRVEDDGWHGGRFGHQVRHPGGRLLG